MNLIASKMGFKRENMNPNYNAHVASLDVMVIHCCIWFEQKISCEGLLRG